MTKKTYEMIAKVVRDLPWGEDVRLSVARAFASELLNTNPRFNTHRFLNACQGVGVKEHVS